MIWQVYWLNSSYWPILNLHAIFVRLSAALDISSSLEALGEKVTERNESTYM